MTHLPKSGMEDRASIRAFRPEDYEEVVALWRESGLTIKPSDTLQELRKLLTLAGTVFLVAEALGSDLPLELIGTVIGAWDGRRAWIYHLAVKPSARRDGIGSRLMRTVEQALRGHGATKINLLVEPDNREAVAFYRALGYSDQRLQFFSKLCNDKKPGHLFSLRIDQPFRQGAVNLYKGAERPISICGQFPRNGCTRRDSFPHRV